MRKMFSGTSGNTMPQIFCFEWAGQFGYDRLDLFER